MSEFLFFLVTVGFPVTGITVVLTMYLVNRYKERRFLIEKGIEIPKESAIFPFSKTTILRTGIICLGLSIGMFTGVLLMDLISNPVVSTDEGVAWGITIPLFTGLSLICGYFIKERN